MVKSVSERESPAIESEASFSSQAGATKSVAIRLVNVHKRFDTFHAVRGLNLDIREGELLVLLGPSGCGKTTTLNMLAGLETPTSGQILFGDRVMNDVPPEERDIAMVFQSIALYPHLNVRDNIAFGLRSRKTPKDEIARRVAEVSKILDIDGLLDRKIHQLSGGQRQRVAIAKALVRRPTLFLLDEPFSSLDAELRRQMRSELIRIHREVETTMVFVTHDQEEAMAIADRIAVMNAGDLVQLGSPLEIYQAPKNLWVARFIGAHPINLLPAEVDRDTGSVTLLSDHRWVVPLPSPVVAAMRATSDASSVILGIRPEHIIVEQGHPVSAHEAAGEIYTRQILGTEILYEINAGDTRLRAVTPAARLFTIGTPVRLSYDWSNVFIFDRQTEQRLFPEPGR
ncbi:MAG: sugar ABC transporter ATP-binding protein [Chloroflexota bacterium]